MQNYILVDKNKKEINYLFAKDLEDAKIQKQKFPIVYSYYKNGFLINYYFTPKYKNV